MPQGSWLGPLTFIVLIDDLSTGCLMHKFVDDTTLSEIIGKDAVSQMETFFGDVLDWSALNLMNINITKTKEMIVGANVNPPPQLVCSNETIERVLCYKLLGVLIDSNLKWDNHVDSMCSKASARLHFLVQLKRNGATVKDMLHFYETVIRSLLEYACPAWHSSLTVDQSSRIEAIQRRSFKVIYGSSSHYENICHDHSHASLSSRREFLCERFFYSIKKKDSCLNYLLPDIRNSATVQGLRNPQYLVADRPRTSRYQKSFIIYALNNYQ
jgi:hypothetical protein